MSRLVNERDASERLGLSVRTLQKWRLQGIGPRFVKLGHAVRYEPEDLEKYIQSARRRSTSEMPRAAEPGPRKDPHRELGVHR